MWADWNFILKQCLVGDVWGEFPDMTTQTTYWSTNGTSLSSLKCGYFFIIYAYVNHCSRTQKPFSLCKDHHLHRSSASLSGPVDTGFRNATPPGLRLAAALHSSVEKTVFPTSVLAPKIWYARRERQSGDASGGGGCGISTSKQWCV